MTPGVIRRLGILQIQTVPQRRYANIRARDQIERPVEPK